MPRGLRLSPQRDPDAARLRREVDREVREAERVLEDRIAAVEARVSAIEAYIEDDLIAWLEGHRAFTGYGTAVPTPSW